MSETTTEATMNGVIEQDGKRYVEIPTGYLPVLVACPTDSTVMSPDTDYDPIILSKKYTTRYIWEGTNDDGSKKSQEYVEAAGGRKCSGGHYSDLFNIAFRMTEKTAPKKRGGGGGGGGSSAVKTAATIAQSLLPSDDDGDSSAVTEYLAACGVATLQPLSGVPTAALRVALKRLV